MHVDDLLTTCTSETEIDIFFTYLRTQFPVITVHEVRMLSYLGMMFDFREEGAVYLTMQKTVDDVLEGCGVDKCFATPATDNLFVIREAPKKVSEKEAVWCRSYVSKVLYIAKRVKPECLTAVSFLTSRVGVVYDIDDLGKVRRLLGYIRKTRTAGVCFRIGSDMIIRVYVDAAYPRWEVTQRRVCGARGRRAAGSEVWKAEECYQIQYGTGDHLPRQLKLYGDNGTRRSNYRAIEAHQYPILSAVRKNQIRRSNVNA